MVTLTLSGAVDKVAVGGVMVHAACSGRLVQLKVTCPVKAAGVIVRA